MLDNDELTYTYQKRQPQASSKLITQERSQKLDLLIHLLTNLHQSLVICGPEGIGKTTLLKQLKNCSPDYWHFCHLIGSTALSFEGITQQLIHSLEGDRGPHLNLSTLREVCDQQKVILIIDDADPLVPGLIGELIHYAESLRGLRLVFAMSYDAYHLKSNTDEALNECHLIELPPLNRKQCAEFVQNIAVLPGSKITLNSLNEARIDELYRITHGIPGKLESEISKRHLPPHSRSWGLWLIFLGAMALGAYVILMLFFEKPAVDQPNLTAKQVQQPNNENIISTSNELSTKLGDAESPGKPTNFNSPFINDSLQSSPSLETLPVLDTTPLGHATANISANTSIQPQAISPSNPIVPNKEQMQPPASPSETVKAVEAKASADVDLSPKPESLPKTLSQAVKQIPSSSTDKTKTTLNRENVSTGNNALVSSPTEDDTGWINEQPSNRYTLQVLTLSTQKAVERFMKKYKEYADIKYLVVNSGNQAKFLVLYGSFETASEAKLHKESMPEEFKLALEKRFSTLQKNRR